MKIVQQFRTYFAKMDIKFELVYKTFAKSVQSNQGPSSTFFIYFWMLRKLGLKLVMLVGQWNVYVEYHTHTLTHNIRLRVLYPVLISGHPSVIRLSLLLMHTTTMAPPSVLDIGSFGHRTGHYFLLSIVLFISLSVISINGVALSE